MGRKDVSRALALLVVPCLLLAAALAAAAAPAPGGYLVDMDGKRVKVEQFVNLMPNFYAEYQDQLVKIPMHDIKSIVRTKSGLRVTNRKGKTYDVQADLVITSSDMITYRSLDPISGQVSDQQMDPDLVNAVGFDWGGK